jgi:hypothetical protein
MSKKVTAPVQTRNFTPEEVLELQEMHRLTTARQFEAAQVKANTALIPRGQEVAGELEAIARLLENAKHLWVTQKLAECGFPPGAKCSINLTTGEITETPETPTT